MTTTEFSSVQTVYVLVSGEQVISHPEFERVKDRFDWLDKKVLLAEMLHLRRLTNAGCRSILAVYEEGKQFKTFLNLSADFHSTDLALHKAS